MAIGSFVFFGAAPGFSKETPSTSESAVGFGEKLGKHPIAWSRLYVEEKNNSSIFHQT
jgi:hypothetical protein